MSVARERIDRKTMKSRNRVRLAACAALVSIAAWGNPIFEGWYADPQIRRYGDSYWVFPTTSDRFARQVSFDAFSSKDMKTWTKHPRILTTNEVSWAQGAMWAPDAHEVGGRYYLFFSANNSYPVGGKREDGEPQAEAKLQGYGGIGVAVADSPEGPYRDLIGKPLVDRFWNRAQPIDQYVFEYKGEWYMVYGGWGRCNLVKLAKDFKSLVPFEDGAMWRDFTPKDYVEGSVMFERKGRWYFMYSSGSWTKDSYCVNYSVGDTPFGPFEFKGKVLASQRPLATGAGHHSVICVPGTDDWYICYHRRPIPSEGRDHRVVCIDRMAFDSNGDIKPVTMTSAASTVDFRTPDGVAGRADDLGGGVWRIRLADAEGRFVERGAVQSLAAFMGEGEPSFGEPDGSRVEVVGNPFALRFYSRSGRLVREITSLSTGADGFMAKGTLSAGEGVYGFGERLDRLNQRGRNILLCSSDGWNKSDTTYAPIPFFVTTSGAGVFVNDYGTMTADMGAVRTGEWSLSGRGRYIDLYVWTTDKMLDAVKGVHRLQGGSLVPPDWATGPVVCRYAPDLSVLDGYIYRKYARRDGQKGKALLGVGVKEMLARYKAMGAKPKAFIMEGWSIEMFGDSETARKRREALKSCGEFLRSEDVKMLVYMRVGSPIDRRCPGFKDEFLVHADIFKNGNIDRSGSDRIPDVYLTGININPDSGKVAGGHAALDITNPAMWDWYVNVVWKELVDLGVSGVKIDFCEELPDDGRDYGAVRVNYKWHDPDVFDGAAVHHAYPSFFVSRFMREMARLTDGKGGFMVLTRGGGIGSGRSPYMWAGDQMRSWDKLDDQVLAVLNSGISGIPFMSYDYGGYQYDGGSYVEPAGVVDLKMGAFDFARTQANPGEETVYVRRGKMLSAEEEERIFSRALAFTAFMPCMQSHGYVRNVYEFGEATRRGYAQVQQMRERLVSYFAQLTKCAAEEGTPVVRPLVLGWQDDPNTHSIGDEFMLGDALLVAPFLGPEMTRKVYLPKGQWREVSSGKIFDARQFGVWVTGKSSGILPPLYVNVASQYSRFFP